jgi:molecular chaperone HtpG
MEVQKNKIQLYSNQVFVTDSVEGIVPEFLTLLHGVLDSPDIPLNVSRSYLQSDSNVKKISGHITKKVSDRLSQLFTETREDFEAKWDDLRLFIEYGMLTEEKFYEKAVKFFLFKNVDGKYFTMDEYETLIKGEQTDKDKNLIYLYTNNPEEQFTFVQAAKNKGYDVLLMNNVLATPLINQLEQKFSNRRFVRVDSDVAEHLIAKEDPKHELSWEEKNELSPIFKAVCPENKDYGFIVDFKDLGENGFPMMITRNEFMRRMKDMSSMQGGGGMSFYGDMPENLNLVVNTSHPLVKQIFEERDAVIGTELEKISGELKVKDLEKAELEKEKKGKKDEEIPSEVKEMSEDIEKAITALKDEQKTKLTTFGKENKLAKQLVDLALLANGMLKGEDLDKFVKRSFELIK